MTTDHLSNAESLLLKLTTAALISAANVAAYADPQTEKEPKENFIQTEITVGAPVLYVRTTNAQGTSSSVSAYGYFLDAALCPFQTSCATLGTHSHLDIK
ncbi:hypothetical protein EBR21_12770, partial [bacterium]|nr:hypothetical protein [bacterium]